jgi:endonuclease/exonuclease/phosphatase family metal-dependent hydrolase
MRVNRSRAMGKWAAGVSWWMVGLAFAVCSACPVRAAGAPQDAAFNVATYNLRYDNPGDGAYGWPQRREVVKALIRFHAFDLFGTQEGLPGQIEDLAALSEYAHVGAGRDDGKDAGEHSTIFFRKSRFTLQRHGDFWLSQTPDRPSMGWDAQCCKRIASWAQLKDRRTGKSFHVFSVHFDHQGDVARRESARLMVRKIGEIAGDGRVICLGDFNSTPETEQIATLRGALRDARQASAAPPYGPAASFNGFQWNAAPRELIDYIFVSKQVTVMKYGVLTDSINQNYPSDHFPVLARLAFE